jgi:hypothetical protein
MPTSSLAGRTTLAARKPNLRHILNRRRVATKPGR